MKTISPEQALHRLAAYCSRSERCVYDVKQKLIRWEIPAEQHMEIIRRLQKERFIDESRFCRAFVNDKSKYGKWGPHKINYELRKKQIPDELIREALAALVPDESREQLVQVLKSKYKTVKGKNGFEIRQKLIRFAAGRGFSLDEIEKALDAIGLE